jgi:DNA-binding PadR family transcriptional regulator
MRSRRTDGIQSNLEIFVLAADRAGQDTAYDLNKTADLSVGATLPLLVRLENEHLLMGKAAARRSRQYSLTKKGRSVLRRGWEGLMCTVPSEFEAILRIAYVASIMDDSLKATRSFLKNAAQERQKLARQRNRSWLSLKPRRSVEDTAGYALTPIR